MWVLYIDHSQKMDTQLTIETTVKETDEAVKVVLQV
jgi:hypothetical protein